MIRHGYAFFATEGSGSTSARDVIVITMDAKTIDSDATFCQVKVSPSRRTADTTATIGTINAAMAATLAESLPTNMVHSK